MTVTAVDEIRFIHQIFDRHSGRWPHTFSFEDDGRYRDFDQNCVRLDAVAQWCVEQFGERKGWRRDTWESFGFSNADQAMIFKLRWC